MNQYFLILSVIIVFPIILGLTYILSQFFEKNENLQERVDKIIEGKGSLVSSHRNYDKGPTKQTLLEKKLKQYFLRNPKKAEKFNLWLYQSDLKLELRIVIPSFLFTWFGIIVIFGIFSSFNILGIIAGSFVGQLLIFYLFVEHMVSRRKARIIEELGHAVDIIARGIKAGSTIEKTFAVVDRELRGPLKKEFSRMLHELEFGISFERVMHSAAQRVDIPDFFFFMSALVIQRKSGGGLSEVLDNIVVSLNKTKEIRMKIKVFSSEGKGSAKILIAIPLVIWGILMQSNATYLEFFLYDSLGKKLLLVIFGLIIATIVTVRKMIDIEV